MGRDRRGARALLGAMMGRVLPKMAMDGKSVARFFDIKNAKKSLFNQKKIIIS